jgi:hypothetical protein
MLNIHNNKDCQTVQPENFRRSYSPRKFDKISYDNYLFDYVFEQLTNFFLVIKTRCLTDYEIIDLFKYVDKFVSFDKKLTMSKFGSRELCLKQIKLLMIFVDVILAQQRKKINIPVCVKLHRSIEKLHVFRSSFINQ